MSNFNRNDRFTIDHTRFIFGTNFSGDPTSDRFASSDRKANIIIPDPDMAKEMIKKGYRIKETKPREDDDLEIFEPEYYVVARLKFRNRYGEPVKYPPIVKLISGNNVPVDLDEDSVSKIDRIRVKDVRLVLNGYEDDDVTHKRSLTIRTMYVTQDMDEDPFAAQYNHYDEDDAF